MVTVRRVRGERRLIVALGLDNLGSGAFLPLVVVYLTGPVGMPVAVASAVLTAATAAGLLVPVVAGRLVDRAGPRVVVLGGLLVQAAGMVAYLVAGRADRGPAALAWVAGAALLVAAGTQAFYSALTLLVVDATPGPTDRALARVEMVRSGAFGAGALLAGALLSAAGPAVLTVALVADAVSTVVAAALLITEVRRRPACADHLPGGAGTGLRGTGEGAGRRVLRNRPFRLLLAVAVLLVLPADVFLVALPVYALDLLRLPGWVPGVCLALLTVASATAATAVVTATAHLARTTSLMLAAVASAVWAAGTAAAGVPAAGWAVAGLIGATALLAVGTLLGGPRLLALAEASAPPARRGSYLAAFQYAYTIATLAATALVGLFAVADWLPWALVAVTSLVGAGLCRRLARSLPPTAVHPRLVAADSAG